MIRFINHSNGGCSGFQPDFPFNLLDRSLSNRILKYSIVYLFIINFLTAKSRLKKILFNMAQRFFNRLLNINCTHSEN